MSNLQPDRSFKRIAPGIPASAAWLERQAHDSPLVVPMVILETKRLTLRHPEMGDFDAPYRLYRDPQIRAHFPGGTRTFADSKRPVHIAGPSTSTEDYINEYSRYRGRDIVAFQECGGTCMRRTRTPAAKQRRADA